MARTDRDEPLCAVWRVSTCLPVLSAAFDTGERAIHAALDGLVRIDVPAERSALRNVNRPEDLVSGE
jgi:molybdopterin-guanine dinucleotide biosynthesis protein A